MNGRFLTIRLLCTVTALLCANVGWAGDWTQFRGPQGSGTLAAGLPAGDGALSLEKGWVREIGSGYSAVVTDGERVVTLYAEGEQDVVGAFSASDGSELWSFELEPTYAGHDGSHDGPIATPLIADGRVYAFGAWGRFVALDLSTGELIWSVHAVEDLEAEKPWYGFGSSPVRSGDNVVFGVVAEEGTLVALNADTGEVAWRTGSSGVEYQSPVIVELAGKEQIVVGAEETVFSVDPTTGASLWVYEHGGRGARGAASLTVLPVGDDRVFIDHDDKQSSLLRISSTDGEFGVEKVWEGRALINSYIPPIEAGGALYGYTTRFLSAVDPETGDELYKSREPGDGFPVAIEDQLVIVTKAGSVHIGAANRDGWEESSALDLFEEHTWSSPAYVEGSLYLRSFGELARVDIVRGAEGMARAEGDVPTQIAKILAAEDRNLAVDEILKSSSPPWFDGNRVTFVWRGEATDVGIGGDMIGVRAEEPMHHLEGTNLWWYEAELPEASRINYAFLVDFEAILDPNNPRKIKSTQFGPDMNIARPEGIEMSWLGMPGWVEPDHYKELPEDHVRGAVAEHKVAFQAPTPEAEEGEEVPETPPEVTIDVTVWTPPGYEESESVYPVAYVLDGEAQRTGGWINSLDLLVGTKVAPIVVVFVDSPRMPPEMATMAFRRNVVGTIESDYRVATDREGRALIGAGGSSFNAFMMAFSEPEFVGRIGAQSWMAMNFQMGMLEGVMGEVTASENPLNIYFEWGALDMRAVKEGWDMRKEAEAMHSNLSSRGYELSGGEVADSSDWASWRNRTDRVLETLFPAAE